jgi:DNA-binding MarR family transcriptional regulator
LLVTKEDYTLDKTDLRIIGQLARDSRLSYEKIGSALNLTRNSIKTRIKRMVSKGVIQEYITETLILQSLVIESITYSQNTKKKALKIVTIEGK